MGEFQLAQAAFLPGLVAEFAVRGAGDDLGAHLLEVLILLVESLDLGRAHESEVQGIEKEHHPLPFVIGKLDLLEFPVRHQRLALKVGRFLSYLSWHHEPPCWNDSIGLLERGSSMQRLSPRFKSFPSPFWPCLGPCRKLE